MELLELAPYVALMVGISALIAGSIPGFKFVNQKHIESQNRRIDGCIEDRTTPLRNRINKLERKINVLVSLVVPQDKIDILKNIEVDTND